VHVFPGIFEFVPDSSDIERPDIHESGDRLPATVAVIFVFKLKVTGVGPSVL
jgi:hypothetical protein